MIKKIRGSIHHNIHFRFVNVSQYYDGFFLNTSIKININLRNEHYVTFFGLK